LESFDGDTVLKDEKRIVNISLLLDDWIKERNGSFIITESITKNGY
jgi:hypothetical protein